MMTHTPGSVSLKILMNEMILLTCHQIKKIFLILIGKNKLLYMIKYSSGLDYKKIYDKVTETRSCVYDDEIDDYSDALMIFEKKCISDEYSDSSIDSSGDSSDGSSDEDEDKMNYHHLLKFNNCNKMCLRINFKK